MPLSVADLAKLGDAPITIRSAAFPNVYLRMDGSGVTSTTDYGGGTVNCQFNSGAPGPYEKYKVRTQADGSIAFESAAFPKVFLRMDATGVTSTTDPGSGTVNCQFDGGAPGPWEKYKARAQADGSISFESTAFPNVFLRMDATGVTSNTGTGGGTVNCQFNANGDLYEKFFLNVDDQRINFVMQHQQQTNWCWSATSVSVAAFYDPATAWTQCSMANAELGRGDCCGAGAAGACNQPWSLNTALARVGRLNQFLAGVLTTAQIGAEMTKSAPVGVRTAWAGGGAHVLVVRGRFLSNGVEYISVADPWYGDSDITYDTFLNRYQGSGSWSHTYKTQR